MTTSSTNGSSLDWLDTVVDPSVARVEVSGDPQICLGLLDGLHERLFGVPVP